MKPRKRAGFDASCFSMKSYGKEKKSRRCNLCSEHFRPRSCFERFCRSCRERDEQLRYSGWMGELSDQIAIKFI